MAQTRMTGIDRWTREKLLEIHAHLKIPMSRIIHMAITSLFIINVPKELEGLANRGLVDALNHQWAEDYTWRLSAIAEERGWTMLEAMENCMELGVSSYEYEIRGRAQQQEEEE